MSAASLHGPALITDGVPPRGTPSISWLSLAMAVLLLITSALSLAAEYDPSRCPDARITAANMIAAVAPDEPPQLSSGTGIDDLVCTMCCQPSPIAATLTDISDTAQSASRHTFFGAKQLATAALGDRLRPPRG